MTDCKLKQEIKEILKTGNHLWLHEEDLDLKTEEIHSLVDKETVKRMMESKDTFFEIRIKNREKHGQ